MCEVRSLLKYGVISILTRFSNLCQHKQYIGSLGMCVFRPQCIKYPLIDYWVGFIYINTVGSRVYMVAISFQLVNFMGCK